MEEALKYENLATWGPLPWDCTVSARIDDKGEKKECEYQSKYFGTYSVDKGGERTLVCQVLSMKGKLIEVLPQNVRLGKPVKFVFDKGGNVLEVDN